MDDRFSFIAPIFVPANRPDRFEKAAASGADAVILDLEDAVAWNRKADARTMLRIDFTDLPVVVRINACDTPWYPEDIEAVERLSPAAILVSKAEISEAFESLSRSIGQRIAVITLLETAHGIADARAIARSPGVVRLAFGSIDYCADLGCGHERDALLAARSEIVLASKLAGRPPPLDGVTLALDDPASVLDDARHAYMLGFGGKLCIHPKQVVPVFTGFAPTAAEFDWASKVTAAGDGAVSIGGAMVDEPVRIRARQIIARSLLTAQSTGSPTAKSEKRG